jgi:hypothetical protein
MADYEGKFGKIATPGDKPGDGSVTTLRGYS